MQGKCAKGKGGLLLEEFLSNPVVEVAMEVIEVKGGIAVLLSEHFGNGDILEFGIEYGPFITESGHVLDTFFMFLLEQCGEDGLSQGVWCQCTVWTGCYLLFLLWG